jgi:hypothetical protein
MRSRDYISSVSGQMKSYSLSGILVILLLLCTSRVVYSLERTVYNCWSGNTALLMPKGKWESGVFQPFRYGLNEKLELRANAFIFPLLPNAGVKFSHGKIRDFDVASEHDLGYPTLFLNFAAAKGVGGLISPQFSFPFMLSFTNSLTFSKPVRSSALLAADLGLAFAVRSGKPDYQATIDMPLIYPRMAHYYEGVSIRAGITYKGTFAKNLFYEENARMFLITRDSENFFLENYGTIMWSASKSFRFKFGYVLSWGEYPFGFHTQLWPVIDIIFGSGIK